MIFSSNQYVIKRKGDLETITVTKDALEEWRDYYNEATDDVKKWVEEGDMDKWHWGFYCGGAAVLTEILKHFEEDFVDDECLPFDGVIDREEEMAEEMTKLNKEWVDSWFDFVKERIKAMEE